MEFEVSDKNKKYKLVAMPIAAVGVMCLAGVLSQFVRNYFEWRAAGGVLGGQTGPTPPSLSIVQAVKSCFADRFGVVCLVIMFFAFLVLLFGALHLGAKENGTRDRERNLTFSDSGAYGTASVMDSDTANKVLLLEDNVSKTPETILGLVENKVACFPLDSELNRNIAVCGPPGSRKSRSFTQNMILQCVRRGESIIVSDTKGEVYANSCRYLEQNGYEVRVFNSDKPYCSDSWDLLGEVQDDELAAQMIADVMVQSTGMGSISFWDSGEKNLLKALLLYVSSLPNPSMSKLYRAIIDSSGAALAGQIRSLKAGHPAKEPFEIFMAQDAVTRGKLVNGLGTRLQVFQNRAVCGMTSHPEIDLTLPGKRKCAYFCISSDQHDAFDFLTTLFITFAFIRLVSFADSQPNRTLPISVHILGEELCNFSAIPGLGKKLSTVRSRGISMSCVFQSIPQLQNRYPNGEWLEILGDCDTQIYFGCADKMTAEYHMASE